MKTVLKVVYVLLCMAVLAAALTDLSRTGSKDIGIFLGYCMLALSFPAGALFGYLAAILLTTADPSGTVFAVSYATLSGMWLGFFVVGYLQWFVLVPWLWRKWKSRRTEDPAATS